MKTTKMAILSAVLLLFTAHLHAESIPGGTVMGKVSDPQTGKPVADATVIFNCQGNQLVFYTNQNGLYNAGNIPAGMYEVTATYMSNKVTVTQVKVSNDMAQELNLALLSGLNMDDVVVEGGPAKKPLLDHFNPTIQTVDRMETSKWPITKVSEIAMNQTGVTEIDGQYFMRGSREGMAYYIDGCKVMGSPNIPMCGLDMHMLYTGYVPPKYGDSLGGIVAIETRNFFGQ